MWSDVTLGPSSKLKRAHNVFIIGPRVLGCETDLQEIMG